MITDFLLNLVVSVPMMLLDAMGDFSIAIPAGVFDGLFIVLANVAFFVPIGGLMPILQISFSIKGTQILWALLIRVKSFIPTMGA